MGASLCVSVYADGGVIGKNPSPIGGTWAYILVDSDRLKVDSGSGVVRPADVGLPAIENNLTELLACLQAMERLPDGWAGVIHTDSQVTVFRLRGKNPKLNGIPEAMRERLRLARGRLGTYSMVLLDGHPTRAHLKAGVGKRGKPVSLWNVECDRECSRLARGVRATQTMRLFE
jgi:ribonuclease HI